MISNASNRSYECNAHNKVHFQPNITDIHPRELYHSHDFQQVLHACHVFQLHFMAGTWYSFSRVCTRLPAATGLLVSIKLSRRKSEPYHSHLWHVVVRVSLGWMSPWTGTYATKASVFEQYLFGTYPKVPHKHGDLTRPHQNNFFPT